MEGAQCFPQSLTIVGFMEAYLTPELFSSEERGCPDKKGREIAPDSGSPLPSSLGHGGLTSPQPRRKVRLSRSPARPFSGKESWRPGRFVLISRLTTQKAQRSAPKRLGMFSDVRADRDLWALPASEHGQPGSLCQGRWPPGETPGWETLAHPEISKTAALNLGCHANHLDILKKDQCPGRSPRDSDRISLAGARAQALKSHW